MAKNNSKPENNRLKRQLSITTLITSGVLSLLGGLNEFIGYFDKIGIYTVILSLATGIVIIFYFPVLLRTTFSGRSALKTLTNKALAILVGMTIMAVGTLPFLWKWYLAGRYASEGRAAVIAGSGTFSNFNWLKAARAYESLSFSEKAVEARIYLAQSYYMLGDTKKAKDILAATDTAADKNLALGAMIYIVRSNISKSQGELSAAEIDLQRALEMAAPGSIDHASALLNYSLLLENKGPSYTGQVGQNMLKAKQIFEKQGYTKGVIISLLNLASYSQYEPVKVKSYLVQAGKLCVSGKYPDMEALLNSDYALLFKNQQQPDSAMARYRLALQQYQSISDIGGQADIQNQIAYLQIATGDHAAALQSVKQSKAYTQLISQSESIINYITLAKLHRGQAQILDELGQTDEAEKQYQAALKVYDDHPDVMEEIETRLAFASFYQNHSRNSHAQQVLDSIEGLFAGDFGNMQHAYVVIAYNNLGKLYKDNGNLGKGKVYLQKSLDMAKAIGDQFLAAQAAENLNIVNSNLGIKDTTQLKQVKNVFRHYHNSSEQIIVDLNAYLQNGDKMTGPQLADASGKLLDSTDNLQVSASAKNQVLLGLQVQDIGPERLLEFKGKLQQLLGVLSPKSSPADYGRCNLSLALVEQRLGNSQNVDKYLAPADSLSGKISYPKSLLYYKKITMLRFYQKKYDKGLDQLFKCIDQSVNQPAEIADREIGGDLNMISRCWALASSSKQKDYIQKVHALNQLTSDNMLAEIYRQFLHGKE